MERHPGSAADLRRRRRRAGQELEQLAVLRRARPSSGATSRMCSRNEFPGFENDAARIRVFIAAAGARPPADARLHRGSPALPAPGPPTWRQRGPRAARLRRQEVRSTGRATPSRPSRWSSPRRRSCIAGARSRTAGTRSSTSSTCPRGFQHRPAASSGSRTARRRGCSRRSTSSTCPAAKTWHRLYRDRSTAIQEVRQPELVDGYGHA